MEKRIFLLLFIISQVYAVFERLESSPEQNLSSLQGGKYVGKIK